MKLNKHYISRLLYELLKLPRVGGRGDFSDVGRALNASTPRETNFRWPDFVLLKGSTRLPWEPDLVLYECALLVTMKQLHNCGGSLKVRLLYTNTLRWKVRLSSKVIQSIVDNTKSVEDLRGRPRMIRPAEFWSFSSLSRSVFDEFPQTASQ